jgi:hypothetical protein
MLASSSSARNGGGGCGGGGGGGGMPRSRGEMMTPSTATDFSSAVWRAQAAAAALNSVGTNSASVHGG